MKKPKYLWMSASNNLGRTTAMMKELIAEAAKTKGKAEIYITSHDIEVLKNALEFYAQKPVPDITSTFAKSAAEWGEGVVTWEPLTDMGEKAREALKAVQETDGST